MKAKVFLAVLLVCALALSGVLVRPANADSLTILKFGTMVGVPSGLTGTKAPIRELNGGGLPWVISGAEGKLTATGKLNVSVTGLVFDPSDPNVQLRGLANFNNQTQFNAVASCLTATGAVVNIKAGPFPATVGLASDGGGSGSLETFVSLPSPCIAPIIFITNAGGTSWFAVTGY